MFARIGLAVSEEDVGGNIGASHFDFKVHCGTFKGDLLTGRQHVSPVARTWVCSGFRDFHPPVITAARRDVRTSKASGNRDYVQCPVFLSVATKSDALALLQIKAMP